MDETFITQEADSQIAHRVYRLRYRIYVEEMGLPLVAGDGGQSLRDGYDDHSILFLLNGAGEDIATLRLTIGDDGPLELEEQNPEWGRTVADFRRRGLVVADITRLMVAAPARGGPALPLLLLAACAACAGRGEGCLFLAGKDGPLGRLYERLGARVLDGRLRPYRVQGVILGQYRLLGIDSNSLAEVRACLQMYAQAAGVTCVSS